MKTILRTSLAFCMLISFSSSMKIFGAIGGPDSFGYTWIDSDEPGGPIFNWIEIATPLGGPGTQRSAVNCDDCHEANIPLGFNFPFYGTMFNQVSLSSNGTIYFENVYLGLSNICIPGTPAYTMSQYRFIAHMWDDLAPNYQGGIYTYAGPNYFVIEYSDIVPCCTAGDGDSWQVILFRNGNILMQYKELSNQGVQSDYTVGIQNDPLTGLQYRCDATGIALASGRAILFNYPGANCAPVSQNIINSTAPLCLGDTVTLGTATGIAQLWSTTAITPTIQGTSGSYSIIALDTNGCTVKDTVAFSAPPTVTLGADTMHCGVSIILDAANPGSTYSWNNGDVTQASTISSTGTYSVLVTDINGCEGSDTINVTINPLPVVSLGTDVEQCAGTVLLDAGNPGATFGWNNGDVTQASTISSTGTYSVLVTDINGCEGSDTINVTINPLPVVSLGTDVEQCAGTVLLDAGNPGATFAWSNGDVAQTSTISSTGTYSVLVTDINGCDGSDTINITIYSLPTVNLGADVEQCGGNVMLDAGNPGATYIWSNGDVTQTSIITSTGNYFVVVTDTNSCDGLDTIDVTIHALPTVGLNIITDTMCVNYSPVNLSGGTPTGGTYSGVGISGGSFNPTTAGIGTHPVQYIYIDANNCSDTAIQNMIVIGCLGLETVSSEISLYPNPTSGIIYISTTVTNPSFVIELVNAVGQTVSVTQINGSITTLDLGNFENGIYFVRVAGEINPYSHKIILNK